MQQTHIRIDIAYDGSAYHGWAKQPGVTTVQEVLEIAFQQVCRTPIVLSVAGRTDAGVHARGQVLHADVPNQIWETIPGRSTRSPAQALCARVQGVLRRNGVRDIVVKQIQPVPLSFDARFCALYRRYCYRVADHAQYLDPLRKDVLFYPRAQIDVSAMHEAVQCLVGEQDFFAFSKPRAGASTVRKIEFCRWSRIPANSQKMDAGLVVLDIQADAFTHSMVRSIVGSSLLVGSGSREISWFAQALAQGQMEHPYRDPAIVVAEPQGLSLEEVGYGPDAASWEQQQEQARRIRGPVH